MIWLLNNDAASSRPERERNNPREIFDIIDKAAVLHQNKARNAQKAESNRSDANRLQV